MDYLNVKIDDSSDEEDYSDVSVLYDEDFQIDAVDETPVISLNQCINNTRRKLINEIEKELNEYEKVSLVYLLYDKPESALRKMIDVVNKNASFIEDWMNNQVYGIKWRKLVEAIRTIKNYKTFKMLVDFINKDKDLWSCLLENETSVSITSIRRYMYCIFETLNADSKEVLLESIKSDFRIKKIQFIEYKYLQMNFIYFEICEYIDTNNCDNLTKHLHTINNEDKFIINEILKSRTDFEEIYEINPNKPGVCLILEYKNFYTECSEEFRHLVLNPEEQLDERIGTHYDSIRLKQIFKKMGFRVIFGKNKTHLETLKIIKEVARCDDTNSSSSFFLCILSHGVQGKIMSINSIPIEVDTIKNIICTPQLEGKPKVLVLQSCQGNKAQTVYEEVRLEEISTIPSTRSLPRTSDILEIWSTVPGYASLCSTTKGSWFIQSFCEVLEIFRNKYHLTDMCIKLQQKVRNKKYIEDGITYVMVCQTNSTLAKFLWMPSAE